MLFSTLPTALSAMLLCAQSTRAMPWKPSRDQAPSTYTPTSDLGRLAPLLPQSELPNPTTQLKYVLLGVGTQNYTCTGAATDAPGTTGATAHLFDIGSALVRDTRSARAKLSAISPLALAFSYKPDSLDRNLQSQGYEHLVGHHFFNQVAAYGANSPVFALDALSAPYPITQVAKLNATDAPNSACGGQTGLPAIQWLYLKDTKGVSQGGIDTVYRVNTAGGNKPATCQGQPASWEVKYAAQYWIYGPSQ